MQHGQRRRRRRTEADDLKGAIYYEVRTALLDLQTRILKGRSNFADRANGETVRGKR